MARLSTEQLAQQIIQLRETAAAVKEKKASLEKEREKTLASIAALCETKPSKRFTITAAESYLDDLDMKAAALEKDIEKELGALKESVNG